MIVKYSFQVNKITHLNKMQLQYFSISSHEYSIWPFDLGLTYIFFSQ